MNRRQIKIQHLL